MADKPKYVECPACDGMGFHLTGHSKKIVFKKVNIQLFGLGAEDCARCEGLGKVPEDSLKKEGNGS